MALIFLNAFITLFVVADPLGTAAVFTVLTSGYDGRRIWRTAFKACVIAFCLLLFFGFCGAALLHHLGISLAAFRIAGGLLLFVTAFRMIFGHHEPDSIERKSSVYADRTDIAIFPVAMPLLAGPGCMTATILLMSGAPVLWDKITIMTAILAVHIVAFVCLLTALPIHKTLGAGAASVLARVMGVLLAAMSIQFIADGIQAMLKGGSLPA